MNPDTQTPESYERLKESIRHHGVIVPITRLYRVHHRADGTTQREYWISDGHHRLQAAMEVKVEDIPVIDWPVGRLAEQRKEVEKTFRTMGDMLMEFDERCHRLSMENFSLTHARSQTHEKLATALGSSRKRINRLEKGREALISKCVHLDTRLKNSYVAHEETLAALNAEVEERERLEALVTDLTRYHKAAQDSCKRAADRNIELTYERDANKLGFTIVGAAWILTVIAWALTLVV